MSKNSGPAGVKRREFLKILGASGAASATVGCGSGRVERLIPYLVSPDNTVPGVSSYYATTCRECSASCGVLAETRDGRVIKLEGNPEHPLNRGALCARGQAAVQGLYNPDRLRRPRVRRDGQLVDVSWEEALQLFSQRLGEYRGAGSLGNAVFVNNHDAGSLAAFIDQWLGAFGMPPALSWDAEADVAAIAAHRQAYGVAWPGFDFAAANLIISFGADFLDGWGAVVPQQLSFAEARARLAGAPRFVYVGARRSLTGLNADEWIPARPGSELAIVNAIRGSSSTREAAEASGVAVESLERLRRDLTSGAPSIVLAGGAGPNGAALVAAVAQLNQTAGNVGTTIRSDQAVAGYERTAPAAELLAAIERMRAGQVPLLMIRGANPVHGLPRALRVEEALANVPFKVSFSSYPDETTVLCDLILPDHHALESWGDAQARPGIVALQQPAMNPVFDTRATTDVLIAIAKADPSAASRYPMADYRSWLLQRFPGGAPAFAQALQSGIAAGSVAISDAPTRAVPAGPAPTPIDQASGDFYFVTYPSPTLGDGRGANKPWLQELPDPVSKICWQSWIEIHPTSARRLGVRHGDVLRVETSAGAVEAPAFVFLGIRQDTVAMPLGQGHTEYGRYAAGIGVNALDAMAVSTDARSGAAAWGVTRARVTPTGRSEPVVTTEGSARQHGRGIAQALLATELGLPPTAQTTDPGAAVEGELIRGAGPQEPPEEHAPSPPPGQPPTEFLPGLRAPVAADAEGDLTSQAAVETGMYDPKHWSGMANRRWAMTIDLARCTGCSACITACYAENNIPTVGAPHQTRHTPGVPRMAGGNILRGREMTWIRLERYFEGGVNADEDFETRFVPMLCQHCGNAPCEPVCPVYATYHAPDGLNVQVYNRCVGTRYCSNNCPYKVRYFNWFGYGEPDRPQYAFPEPLNWQLNPDVTVRAKGVMEKCTFCVQRIRESEHVARAEDRELRPDEFTVACAQACPSRAIVFGDAADGRWAVARQLGDERRYHVFEELNTYTAVVYLKKVNHPPADAPVGVPVPVGG
ncbi:MAG TPA: molybdopterin-dependent oxidoreductase [Gemmatimonadaceae bacterium]|nr:molybdopterin-dependent oxidoreductase [Gemmatimonadaceae bacterium]